MLAYHNVIARGTGLMWGERSLHVPLDKFEEHLDAIRDAGIESVRLDAPPNPREPQVAITFDDAYATSLELAIPALAARGMPATVFVAPGLLGDPAPWWDRLADPTTGGVRIPLRDALLDQYAGDAARILAAASSTGTPVFPTLPEHRIGTEGDIHRALECHTGLTVAPHSWHHLNLTRVSQADLEREVEMPLNWLLARWPDRTLRWLAYPYGLEDGTVREAARRASYLGAVVLTGRWHDPSVAHPMATPRFNVTPGLSLHGFRARLAGTL